MTVKGFAVTLGIVVVGIALYHNGMLNFIPTFSEPKK